MMRRRRGPGLIGTAARTAVVVGTAGAVANKQQQRHARKAAEAEQAQQPQAAAPAPPPAAAAPAPPAEGGGDYLAELQELAKLHQAGILTEEEFAAKKAQILGL